MARLPTADDLRPLAYQPSTPGINVRSPDYGAIAKAGDGLAQGMSGVGHGLQVMAKAENEIDDYETSKRLLDFKLQSEMELENMKRDMPAGGEGWAASWDKKYLEMARGFVGKDDGNVPAHLRQKIGMALKQHETALSERATRYEWAERDRFHVDGLETDLGKLRDVVGANPNRRDEMGEAGRKQIDLSRIPQADKHRLLKKYDKELDKSQATGRLLSMQNADDREALRRELRLDQEDVTGSDVSSTLTSGVAKGKPAGWAATDPRWAKLDPFQKAAAMALMEADNADPQAARNALGAMINRAAKTGEDLGAHVSQKIYQPTIEPAQQARLGKIINSKAFDDLTSWASRRAAGQEEDPVQGATHFLASEKTMLALESREPQKYRSWRKWTGFDGNEYRGVITRDASHAFLAPEGKREDTLKEPEPGAPRAPYSNLTIMERREIWNKAEAEWKKKISETDQLIKHMSERATNGDLPPDAELKSIGAKVQQLGDERLSQHFQSVVSTAAIQNRMYDAPPGAGESYAQRLRSEIATAQDGRYTEEQAKLLDKLDKTAVTVRKNVNEDPMGWVNRRQLEVPVGDIIAPGTADEFGKPVPQAMKKIQLQQIDFSPNNPNLDVQLRQQFDDAKAVARYYNQPVQVFSKGQRDALKDFIGNGGPAMLHVIGKIVANGGDDATAALREISKDAPEAFMIGRLMQDGGDPYLITSAAKEIQKRATEKEKYINKVDKKLSEPDVAALMPALQMTSGLQDPVKHMTDLLYNFEHRRQGKDKFDATLYKDTMRKVLGERKDAKGNVYGGVGDQGNAWFGLWPDGKSSTKVQVPSEVRQDSFDAMVNAVRLEDFGGNVPAFDNKQPMSLRDIQTSQWRSLGNGRYALYLGQNEEGKDKFAGDAAGNFYVLDIKPMLGKIRQRKPEIFDSAAPMRLADDQLDTLDQIIPYLSKVGKDYQPGPNESDMVDDQRPSTLLTKGYNLKPSVHRPARIDDTPEQLRNLLPN